MGGVAGERLEARGCGRRRNREEEEEDKEAGREGGGKQGRRGVGCGEEERKQLPAGQIMVLGGRGRERCSRRK